VTLALTGTGLGILGGIRKNDSLKGIGLGLAIQSSAMLTLDLFAAKRAEVYADSLEHLEPSRTSSAIVLPSPRFSALLIDQEF
jgi:hypothetical protein